jgi:hypothetical protein
MLSLFSVLLQVAILHNFFAGQGGWVITKRHHDIHHNNTKQKDTQHNDT